jgi:DNA (cytosine-5)-methyltransferase 1
VKEDQYTPTIRAVDLFCGVGGLTHGLAQAGIEVVAGIDIDPACKYPYEANNKAKFIEGDVNELSSSDVAGMLGGADISMIAGCAPCQPFSTYSRSGRSKKRGRTGNWSRHSEKLVKEVQPDLVTMENVPQLLDHPVFEQFLENLEGYSVEWSVVQAVRVGIPQTRKRLVLIASKLGADGLTLLQDEQTVKTVREAIGRLRPIKAGESDPKDRLHIASRLSKTNLERIQHSKPGGTWRDWPTSFKRHAIGRARARRTRACTVGCHGMRQARPSPPSASATGTGDSVILSRIGLSRCAKPRSSKPSRRNTSSCAQMSRFGSVCWDG